MNDNVHLLRNILCRRRYITPQTQGAFNTLSPILSPDVRRQNLGADIKATQKWRLSHNCYNLMC